MNTLLMFLLQIDTALPVVQHFPSPTLPNPPIGGTKQDWLGYAVTVGVTALVGIITRAIEKRRMRRRYKKESE
jgi:hypothetical protein